MNQNRHTNTGQYAHKRKQKNITPVIILLVLLVAGGLAIAHRSTLARVHAVLADSVATETVSKQQAGARQYQDTITQEQLNKARELQELAPYRTRADIVKQQEALVRQAYLSDKRARLQADLATVEQQLDATRAELVGFQSAPER